MIERALKSDWKMWRFDQIATSVAERVEPGATDAEYYVGLEHLDSDSLKIRRWGKPSDVEATKLLFRRGDIIFGRRRAYQRKLAVAEFDGICSAHAMILRPKTDVVLPDFLPFFMQSDLFMNRALGISVGSLSPTINWRTLAKQEFALPPLAEQRRIATVLKANESLMQELRQMVETSFELRKSVQENLLLGSAQDLPRVRIGTLMKVNPREPSLPEDAPFVPMHAIQEWNRNIQIFETRGSRGGIRAKSGDILMARIAPCLENGKTAQIPNTIARCGGSTELIVLRPKKDSTSDYVYWVVTAPSVRHRAIGLMIGSTGRQRVSAQDIARIRIPLAPKARRVEAIELLNNLETEHELLTHRIESCKALKKQIIFELLNGGGK